MSSLVGAGGAAGIAQRQGRWAKHGFRLEVTACDMAHEELSRAGTKIAGVHRDAAQGGKRVPGFLDVIETDDVEVDTHRNARLHQRASEPDRDNVIETKRGSRGIAEVEQLRNRRPTARIVGGRFDDERRVK